MKKIITIIILVMFSLSIVFSFSEEDNIRLSHEYDEITLPSGVDYDLGLVAYNGDEEIEMKLSLERAALDDENHLVVGDYKLVIKVKPHKRYIEYKEITLHVVDRSEQPEVTRNESEYRFE